MFFIANNTIRMLYKGMTQDFVNSITNDISIIVKNNFSLDESEQGTLAARIKEFYFRNESSSSACIPYLVDVGIETRDAVISVTLISLHSKPIRISAVLGFAFPEILQSHRLSDTVKCAALYLSVRS